MKKILENFSKTYHFMIVEIFYQTIIYNRFYNEKKLMEPKKMSKAILSFDTDRIKEYVFSTQVLKEIRGASAILDTLNRREMYRYIKLIDPAAERIFANGGSGMFMVSDATKAEKCITTIEKLYNDETLTASISGAYIPYDDLSDFSNAFKVLSYRLRQTKDAKISPSNPVTHSFMKPCDSCGNEYARYSMMGEVICKSCFKKRKKDKNIKDKIEEMILSPGIFEQDDQLIKFTKDQTWGWLLSKLIIDPDYSTQGKSRADDFETLGQLSVPNNYIGVIYADGNNMGRRLESLNSTEQFRSFSDIVDNAIRNAVLDAVRQHLEPKKEYFPFDILLLGGDDLVMVTTAQQVIETAVTITKKFREYTGLNFEKKQLGPPLELSVGVAIAHAKYPIGSLLKLAEDLLKFAKKEASKRFYKGDTTHSDRAMINFQVVNAGSCLDLGDNFNRNLTSRDADNKKYFRTLRPYDMESVENILISSIKELRKSAFPRNKLQALREAVFLDYNNSILSCLAARNRLKNEQRALIEKIFRKCSQNKKFDPFPWFVKNDAFFTPFLDVAELYDFIQ